MRIFITGATGLIGTHLAADRLQRGDEVRALSRSAAKAAQRFAHLNSPNLHVIEGDPAQAGDWQRAIDGCDAVVNLAGASIGDKRWSDSYKRELLTSRVESARHVIHAMRTADIRPRTLVNASAIGYYGDSGDTPAIEASPPGDDFLAKLCVQWEAAADPAAELGVRVVKTRFGVVLDSREGALPKMALPFRLFLGGPIGNGHAYVSWIHWEDIITGIGFALDTEAVSGPVNVTSPQPVRGRDFAAAIAGALHRPCWLPVPKFALRLLMGEVAKYATASCRVVPGRLQHFGYTFQHPNIAQAMQSLLGRD